MVSGILRLLLCSSPVVAIRHGTGANRSHMDLPSYMEANVITRPSDVPCEFGSVQAHDCNLDFSRLAIKSIPVPSVPAGHALIKVAAASLNPCEWKNQFVGNNIFGAPLQYPYTTGFDFSGVVVRSESPCSFKNGDAVWGTAGGAHAEYMLQACNGLGKKPEALNFCEAGTLGVAVLTSLQSLSIVGAPWQSPVTVLVIGGSSGTGHFGIQLAKAQGAQKVITTCSPDNFEFVRSLGADEVIDYHTQNYWEVIPPGSVDIVYDCIGNPGTGNHVYTVLTDNGKFVTVLADRTLADPAIAQTKPGVSQTAMFCTETSTPYLQKITQMADAGKLRVHLDNVLEGLDKVPQLYKTQMGGHVVGKVSLKVDDGISCDR